MKDTSNLDKQAQSLFSKFCSGLAQIDLRTAVAVPAIIGVVTTMYGLGLDVHGQSQLLQEGGLQAVQAYKAAMQVAPVDSLLEYSKLAFEGKLPSFGGNAQGIGVTVSFVGPVIAAGAVTLARGFGKVKDFLSEKFWQANARQLEDDMYGAPGRVIAALNNRTLDASHKLRGVPLLAIALGQNDLKLAKALIDAGADVNAYADRPAVERGMAPIHFARSPAAVDLLSRAGANIDAPYKHVDHAYGMRGETALHSAALDASGKGLALAQALLRAGADPAKPFSAKEYQYDRQSLVPVTDRVTRAGKSIEQLIAVTELRFAGSMPPTSTALSGSIALQTMDAKRGAAFHVPSRTKGLDGQEFDQEPASGLRI